VMERIETIGELKRAIAEVLAGISASCASCTYPDCQGFPWVLPAEEDELLAAGIQLIQLNGPSGPTFLDTLPRDEAGDVVLGTTGPPCPYRGRDGQCTVHESRPLTCHLYPLSIELVGGLPHWAVHRDCEHVQRAIGRGEYDSLLRQLAAVIARIGAGLSDSLADTLGRVATVSGPTQLDCFTVIRAVRYDQDQHDHDQHDHDQHDHDQPAVGHVS
jgi:Fe-S-cluster containining protein